MHLMAGRMLSAEQAWQLAGSPSYGEIARVSEELYKSTKASGMRVEILPRSTIQEILRET
jgi:hypothetical protein